MKLRKIMAGIVATSVAGTMAVAASQRLVEGDGKSLDGRSCQA